MKIVTSLVLALLISSAAHAEPQDSSTSLSPNAERRGRGTKKLVSGALMLPLGFLVLAASAGLYYFVPRTQDSVQRGYVAGGVALDVVGLGLLSAGGAFIAIGAGELAATAPDQNTQAAARVGVTLAF